MMFKATLRLDPEEYVPAAAPHRAPSTFRAADYRISPGANLANPHWLLAHPYGRDVLINALRETRPDLQFPRFRTPPELEQFLDCMIDLMGLRSWPQPQTMGERFRVGVFLLRIGFAQASKLGPVPDWRSLYRAAQ